MNDESVAFDDDSVDLAILPSAPVLTGPPLTVDAAADRVAAALAQFEQAADGLAELDASGTNILDDLQAMTEDMFAAEEFVT